MYRKDKYFFKCLEVSSAIISSNFVTSIHVIEYIFCLTLPLRTALQKININLSYCHERVAYVQF